MRPLIVRLRTDIESVGAIHESPVRQNKKVSPHSTLLVWGFLLSYVNADTLADNICGSLHNKAYGFCNLSVSADDLTHIILGYVKLKRHVVALNSFDNRNLIGFVNNSLCDIGKNNLKLYHDKISR